MAETKKANRYWKKRHVEEALKLLQLSEDETATLMQAVYLRASRGLVDELIALYAKINERENPTANTALQYIRKYGMLKTISKELDGLERKTVDIILRKLEEGYGRAYELTGKTLADAEEAGANSKYGKPDAKRAKAAAKEIWATDGKSWSERLWGNTAALKQKLADALPAAISNGTGAMKLTEELMHAFSVSYSAARRLATTEMAHVYNAAALDRMKAAGVKEYEWLDSGKAVTIKGNPVCLVCKELNGKRFPVDDREHIPPSGSHPYCRCTIVAVLEDII